MARKYNRNKKGFALTTVVVALSVLMFLLIALSLRTIPFLRIGANFFDDIQARYQTEAGVSRLIATIRGNTSQLPIDNGSWSAIPLSVDSGFSFSNMVNVIKVNNNTYTATVTGCGSNGAFKSNAVFFSTYICNLPSIVDGVVSIYSTGACPSIDININEKKNHGTPIDFNCNGVTCWGGGQQNSSSDIMTLVYYSSPGSTSGNNSLQGLLDLIDCISNNVANYQVGQVGTRSNPLITVIPTGATWTMTTNGAGVIIVQDCATLAIDDHRHYEGIIILQGSARLVGGDNTYVFGSLIYVNPTASLISFANPSIHYSTPAIENIQQIKPVNILW